MQNQSREELRAEILEHIGSAWDEHPELSFGRFLLEVLQPERRIKELRELDDEWFLGCLESYLSVSVVD